MRFRGMSAAMFVLLLWLASAGALVFSSVALGESDHGGHIGHCPCRTEVETMLDRQIGWAVRVIERIGEWLDRSRHDGTGHPRARECSCF